MKRERDPRLVQAFRSMKDLGISENKVKPVIKKLLKLYDKNWEIIMEDNYRVLADAIFDEEDSKVSECENDMKHNEQDSEEDDSIPDELERPLKRIHHLRNREVVVPSSHGNSSTNVAGNILEKPEVDDELPPALQEQSLQAYAGNLRTECLPTSPGRLSSQPASSLSPNHYVRKHDKQEPNSQSAQMHVRSKGKEPLSAHAASNEKGPGRSSPTLCIKNPTPKPAVSPKNMVPSTHALILPKEEPYTDDMPLDEIPIAVIHPDSPSRRKMPTGVGTAGNWEKPLESMHAEENGGAGVTDSASRRKMPTGVGTAGNWEEPPESMHAEENGGAGVSDSPSRRKMPTGVGTSGNWEEPPESMDAEGTGGVGVSAATSERHTSCYLATNSDETPASLEIASSKLGEVKISISYNSAIGRPNFQLPSIDKLRELMEQKCLCSYKLIDPNFDVIKILNDMCECISEVAANSSNQSQEVNMTPALDVLKKSPVRNALGVESNEETGSLPTRMSNGSLNAQCSANGCIDNEGKALVAVPDHELTPNELRWLHHIHDVTRGEEKVKISWVNEIDHNFPPPFQYISGNLVYQNANVSFSLSRIGDENCCPTCFGDCLLSQPPCACACKAGEGFFYTLAGVVKEDFLEECISMTHDPQQQRLLYCTECPLERSKKDDFPEPCKGHLKRNVIKECWTRCGCNKECGNRVVQRGLNYKLQVFLTPNGKGWGLRTLEKLPKGAFVCEFVGEILTISEFYARNTEKNTIPTLLDAYWGLRGASKDEEALCLDATFYGNVSRFINHRCLDANLIEIPVEVESPNLHYYHLAFFTTREVDALEELTWDYGIDFDDLDHPIKAFRCRCGSKFCRNMKRSTGSKSAIIT